ncbi:MAG TPA: VOC family protein [Thermoanaerobaculia bacterium]|nr:VOC family protein [Thermoanaerobaculia bacterium]
MLGEKRALATVAVKDLAAGERFYAQTLGLEVTGREGSETVTFKAGDSEMLLYRSELAGGNRATAVTWIVGADLEKVVEQLDSKGVEFQHYDLPGMSLTGHVHSAGDLRVAWFTDPEGNIHSLVTA